MSFFKTGREPYPVERTLLAGGVCDAALHSRAEGKPLATPQLEFAYAARDFGQFRERGASWKILEKVAETENITSSEADLQQRLEQLAAQMNQRVEAVKSQLQKKDRLEDLRAVIQEEKTLDFLLSQAKIVEGKSALEEGK